MYMTRLYNARYIYCCLSNFGEMFFIPSIERRIRTQYIKKTKDCYNLLISNRFSCSRLLFHHSGYLPWRLRRKKKDK